MQFHWIRWWPELSQLPRAVIFFLDSYRNIQKISKKPKSTSLENQGASIFTIHGLITGKSSPEMWSNTTNSRGFPTDFPSKMSWLSIKATNPRARTASAEALGPTAVKVSESLSWFFRGRLSDVSEHFLDQKWGFPKMGVPGYPQIIPNHPKSSILIGFSISHPFSIHRAST